MNAEQRADRLGITLLAYVALGNRDRRNVMDPMFGSAAMKAWLAAGMPEPDWSRFEFRGATPVRKVVLDVLRSVPMAAAWLGVEHVAWIEVGRDARGWTGGAGSRREIMITLCGRHDDEALRHVVAHELGHAIHRPIGFTEATTISRPREEVLAALESDLAPGEWARIESASERAADDFAQLCGYRRHHHH